MAQKKYEKIHSENRSHEERKEVRLAGRHSLSDNTLQRKLLLLQVISTGVLDLELLHGIRESRLNLLTGSTLELEGHGGIRNNLLNTGDVRLKLLAGLVLLGESIVGGLELLGIGDGLLDLSGGELANGVGDGDVGRAARRLLGGSDLEDTVGVNLEDDLKDSITSLHGRDGSKSELSEGGVVLAVDTLTLVDRELNGRLVVGNSGEGTLLESRDGGTAGNDGGEDVTLHGDTEREGADIQKQEVGGLLRGGLAGKDTGLDSGTIGNSLIGVDALLELLAVEQVAQHLLDLGDTGRTTDKDDLINLLLSDTRILENLLNGGNGVLEESGVDILETSTSDGGIEVLTTVEGVNLKAVWVTEERVRLARSQAERRRRRARGSSEISCFVLRLNSALKCSRRAVSKS
jgi:hypothetical protein